MPHFQCFLWHSYHESEVLPIWGFPLQGTTKETFPGLVNANSCFVAFTKPRKVSLVVPRTTRIRVGNGCLTLWPLFLLGCC